MTTTLSRADHVTPPVELSPEFQQANEAPVPEWLTPAVSGGQVDRSGSDTRQTHVDLFDPLLLIQAEAVHDLERTRIANENRLRSLTQVYGLTALSPEVATLTMLVEAIHECEKSAVKSLQKAMRRHPLGGFVKSSRGLGDLRMARLLAVIGDPYWNTAKDEPRTVSQLWAYCGLHTLPVATRDRDDPMMRATGTILPSDPTMPDTHRSPVGGVRLSSSGEGQMLYDDPLSSTRAAARRRKGVKANWNTRAKTRAWLNIESCLKQLDAPCKRDGGIAEHQPECKCSPYRIVIDQRRQHTALTHSDWTPGHSLNDAMRVASKTLLRDLWREAKRLHEEAS